MFLLLSQAPTSPFLSLSFSASLMEGTSVSSMNFDDEDEGIPESPHSSLSPASLGGQNTPIFNLPSSSSPSSSFTSSRSSSSSPSAYVRTYSDTDSAYGGDSDCLYHLLPIDCHVVFFFLKSQRLSYDHLWKCLESSVTQVRSKRQTEYPGFILKSLEQGVKMPVMYSQVIGEAQGANVFLSPSDLCQDGITLQQAIYKKVDSISVPVISTITPNNGHQLRHLIIGFNHVQPFTMETFEENWKDMSGARALYLTPCASVGLSQINFYKRIKSTKCDTSTASHRPDIDTYSHIVQAIFKSACGNEELLILDMVHRLRLRVKGIMGVYAQVATLVNNKEDVPGE